MQKRIYDAMIAYVRERSALVNPTQNDVIGTAAARTSTTIAEVEETWDRLMPYSEDLWVTSLGRVALRGSEARPVPRGERYAVLLPDHH